jgi:hypothetical protein
MTVRLLQTGCGVLVVASLVALGRPTPVVVAHDGAATVASRHTAVPTEWSRGGPLAIPTIGVVPPGAGDWFDPEAQPPVQARAAPSAPVVLPSPNPVAAGTAEAHPPTTGSVAPTVPSTSSTAPASPTAQRTEPPADETHLTTTPPTPTTTSPTAPEPPLPTGGSPTPPAPATNERGNVVLAFGEELTASDNASGAAAFGITVTGVELEVTCTDPASVPPVNGFLIAVRVRATTGPDLAAVGGEPTVRAADFRFLAPEGTTLTEVATPGADACLSDAEEFPAGPLPAGQQTAGVVVLDVPETAGTLVLAPGFLSAGAEWEFGPPAAG